MNKKKNGSLDCAPAAEDGQKMPDGARARCGCISVLFYRSSARKLLLCSHRQKIGSKLQDFAKIEK